MKSIEFFAGALISMGLLSSCGNGEYLTKSTESAEQSILASNTAVLHRPIVAELKIGETRKSVTYEADLLLPMEDLRENALAKFLSEHQCDFALDPVYRETVVQKRRSLSSVTIVVEAFPADYVSFEQVDSIPKSILEFHRMDVPLERVDYLTKRELPETNVGVDLTFGNFIGWQVDAKLRSSDWRLYAAGETYWDGMLDSREFEFEVNENGFIEDYSRGVREMSTLSVGLMREYALNRRVTARALGGLHFGTYEVSDVYVGNRSFESLILGGLRLGAGVDARLFRSVYLVGKVQRDLNIARVVLWNGEDETPGYELTSKKFNAPLGFGLGLRFEF